MLFTDEYFMKKAFSMAEEAIEKDEVPVGAVIVCNNQIIAKAHNQTEQLIDVTAHAEIIAITAASEYLGSKYLTDCILYVTLEPCIMCAGALAWSRISKVVFGTSDEKRGFLQYGQQLLHPKTELIGGILENDCRYLLSTFFKNKR